MSLKQRRSPRPHIVHTKDPRFHSPQYQRGKGLFNPDVKWKKYAEIIRIDKLDEAKLSIERLEEEFDESKHRPKKLRIINSMNEAASRAEVGGRNHNFSEEERREMRDVAAVYSGAVTRLRAKYKD